MLYEILKHIRNFFPCAKMEQGSFTISDGTISLSFVPNGAYVLIEGSVFNDGIYKYPIANGTLTDETFDGSISVRAIPKDFLALAEEITTYKEGHTLDGLQSESFGGYSYSRATNTAGGIADWQDVFKERLNAWRKI